MAWPASADAIISRETSNRKAREDCTFASARATSACTVGRPPRLDWLRVGVFPFASSTNESIAALAIPSPTAVNAQLNKTNVPRAVKSPRYSGLSFKR